MPSKIGTAGVVATRPAAVAFDVIETLMPLEPLRERFTAAGLPAHLLELWFARTRGTGSCWPPPAITRRSARSRRCAADRLRLWADAVTIGQVLAGLDELPAHPDVLPAGRLLAAEILEVEDGQIVRGGLIYDAQELRAAMAGGGG